MAILTFPASLPAPNSMRLGLSANTQSGGRSPFDGTEQTLALPGARWVAELRYTNLTLPDHRVMDGFVAALGGRAGRFTWSPPRPRRATRGGSAQVFGGGQTGTLLTTGFWSGSGLCFAAGDMFSYINVAGRPILHMATADATVDGSNACTVSIAPMIRRIPSDGALLNLTAPTAVWRLAEDAVMTDYAPGGFADVVLSIEEAIW